MDKSRTVATQDDVSPGAIFRSKSGRAKYDWKVISRNDEREIVQIETQGGTYWRWWCSPRVLVRDAELVSKA